jgi:hypothetical protein
MTISSEFDRCHEDDVSSDLIDVPRHFVHVVATSETTYLTEPDRATTPTLAVWWDGRLETTLVHKISFADGTVKLVRPRGRDWRYISEDSCSSRWGRPRYGHGHQGGDG